MSAQPGGVPRFGPDVEVNFRALPTFNPQANEMAARLFAQASNVFGDITNTMLEMHKRRVMVDSELAGEKAGQDVQNFDAEKLPAGYTLADQAYREAAFRSHEDAVKSYLSQLEIDRDNKFQLLQLNYLGTPENQRNPALLQEQFNSYIDETAKNLPKDISAPFSHMAAVKANPIIFDAHKDYISYQQKRAKEDGEAVEEVFKRALLAQPLPHGDAQQKAYDLNMAQYLEALKAQGMSEEQAKAEVLSFAQDELQPAALIRGYYEAKDKLAYIDGVANRTAAELGTTDKGKDYAVEKMKGQFNDARFDEEQQYNTLSFQQKTDLAFAKGEMERMVDDGSATEGDLIDFGKKFQGFLKPEWVGDQRSKLAGVRAKNAEEEARIQATINGEIPIDQTAEQTQGLLDKYFSRLVKRGQPVQGAAVTGVFGEARPGHRHDGVDLAAPQGSSIKSVLGGKVTYVGPKGGYGNVVEVMQDDGTKALYGHTSKSLVKKGDTVSAAQPIALVGSTGNSTGPHLHLTIYGKGGQAIDPQKYLKGGNAPPNLDALMTKAMLNTGVVPTIYRNQLVNMLHGTPQQQAEAASRYGWMMDNNIDIKGLSERDKGLMARIDQELRRGVDGNRAVEIARFDTDPNNKNLLEANKDRVESILKKDENKVDRVFESGGFFGWGKSNPSMPLLGGVKDNMAADWNTAFQQAYIQTGGDEGAARAEAQRKLKKMYGVSQVTGAQQLMKYPPEKFYGLRGYDDTKNADWMKKQLNDDLRGQFMPAVTSSDVFLMVDRSTPKGLNNGRPDYLLYHKTSQGLFAPLIMDGKQVRWAPEPDKEVARINAERKRQADKEVEQGRVLEAQAAKSKPKPFNMIGK